MPGTHATEQIALSPDRMLRFMIAVIGVLVALHLVGLYLRFGLGRDYALGFVPLFHLDSEKNAPTLYNSMLLVGAGLLAVLAAKSAPKFRLRWWVIGLVLVTLGIDETFGLHEPVFFVLRGNESAATAAWVRLFGGIEFSDLWPYMALIFAILLVWYWPLIRQDRRITVLGIGAIAIYLLGALGLDLVIAAERAGQYSTFAIVAIGTLEEVAELLGSSLFVYTIASYIADVQGTTISISRRA